MEYIMQYIKIKHLNHYKFAILFTNQGHLQRSSNSSKKDCCLNTDKKDPQPHHPTGEPRTLYIPAD